MYVQYEFHRRYYVLFIRIANFLLTFSKLSQRYTHQGVYLGTVEFLILADIEPCYGLASHSGGSRNNPGPGRF